MKCAIQITNNDTQLDVGISYSYLSITNVDIKLLINYDIYTLRIFALFEAMYTAVKE